MMITLMQETTATGKYCDFGKFAVVSCCSNFLVYEYNNETPVNITRVAREDLV